MTSEFSRDLTPEQIHDRVAWLKARAQEGSAALHSRATGADLIAKKLTDAESAAIARARIDRSNP